jgi:hypothetical protein
MCLVLYEEEEHKYASHLEENDKNEERKDDEVEKEKGNPYVSGKQCLQYGTTDYRGEKRG